MCVGVCVSVCVCANERMCVCANVRMCACVCAMNVWKLRNKINLICVLSTRSIRPSDFSDRHYFIIAGHVCTCVSVSVSVCVSESLSVCVFACVNVCATHATIPQA